MPIVTTENAQPIVVREMPTVVADIVAAFFRNRRAIVAAVLTFIVLATVLIVVARNKYESRMVFLVRNEGAAFAITSFEDQAPPQIMQTNETQLGTEIELLSGTELHRQVITALHPELRGKSIEHELLSFDKHLKMLPIPKTTLIAVTYGGKSPEEANATLATLSKLYLAYRARIRGSEGAYAFFDQEAKRYYAKLQEDQGKLAEFNKNYQVAQLAEEKDVVAHRLSDAHAVLYENEAATREAEKKIETMAWKRETIAPRIVTQQRELPDQSGSDRLNSILVDLQNERVGLLTKFHPTDRHVQEVDDKIANIREALKQAQQSKATEVQSDLNPLRQTIESDLEQARFRDAGLHARERSLTEQVNAYDARLQQLNQITGQYQDLSRNVREDEANYDLYSKKREQARIDRTLDNDKIANVRQVSGPSIIPQGKLQLFFSIGIVYLLGTLLIVGLGILAGLWSPRFYSPWELEAAVDALVLATIPMLPEGPPRWALPGPTVEAPLLSLKASDSASTSIFPRILGWGRPAQQFESDDGCVGGIHSDCSRSNGAYLPLIGKLRRIEPSLPGAAVFAVTACTRGEGVTHFVRGLGAELAKYTGKRVAVVDAPDTYECDGACTGLASHQLQARSTGGGEEFLKHWFRQLRARHDYVLIDCPSLSASQAAAVLGPQSDGLLLVVGAGDATRIQLRGGLTMLSRASVPLIGLALNKRRYPVPDTIYSRL